ncbi:hypothetical protein GQ44DRAFT_250789 [Phaeosphaeriaceae sp. PMI808]|nr:hypothetical protein GQ44DRAFT_250789 [Phaeosphaeriaceae sp. PMI808]
MSTSPSKKIAAHFIDSLPKPELRIGQVKRSTATYLDSYRRHRHVVISRGSLSPSDHRDKYTDNDLPSQSEDTNEQLLDRLAYTRKEAIDGLLQLYHQLSRVSEALKARRRVAYVRSSIFTGIVIASTLSHSLSSLNIRPKLLRWLPAFFMEWFPFLLVSLGALPLIFHERRMSCTTAALTRVEMVLQRVEASKSVRSEDVEWIEAEYWEGVDWPMIGL